MSILSLTGQIIVRVDDVAVEQTTIDHPKLIEGFPEALIAMVAALHLEQVKSLSNQLMKAHHGLTYESAERVDNEWLIKFNIGKSAKYLAEAVKDTEEQ